MQIGAGLRRARLGVPVAHPAEVLARAFAPPGAAEQEIGAP